MADQAKLNAIIEWLSEKKADNIRIYDVHATSGYTDMIVVCEGAADLHNQAMANHLLGMAKECKLSVVSKEGMDYGNWILIDMLDVVVHIFLPEARRFYNVDELFEKAQYTKIEETTK